MPRVEKFSYTRLLVQKDGHNITRKCKVQNPNHWACIYLLAGCGRLHRQVTFALSSSITRQQRGSGWSRCHRRFFFFLFPPKPWHYGRGALWSLFGQSLPPSLPESGARPVLFAVSSCAFAHHLLVRYVWQRASAQLSIAQLRHRTTWQGMCMVSNTNSYSLRDQKALY